MGLAAGLGAAEFPQAEIANGLVRAKLYLPDAQNGYYRATRFDWSGVIASLEYKGHNYFGVWFPRYDPKLHDSITGPVESFSALWFDEAKPGDTFVRIGVGVLRRPDDRKVNDFFTYDIVDPGKWKTRTRDDSVEMTQELAGTYVYRKTVRLEKKKPVLVLEHSLRNTGKKVIETNVFNHDFYMLDGQPTGPDVIGDVPLRSAHRPRVARRGRDPRQAVRVSQGAAAGAVRLRRDEGVRRDRGRLRFPGGEPQDRGGCAADRRPAALAPVLLVDPDDGLPGSLQSPAGGAGPGSPLARGVRVLRNENQVTELEADAVHVWSAALDDAAQVEPCRAVLSAAERERAGRFHFEHLTRRYIIGRGFLRDVLGRYLGAGAAALEIETGEHGKPFVAGAEIQFNLSHSGDLAVCAFTRGRRIGADVECIRPVEEIDAIVGRFFTAGEAHKIRSAAVRERAFFECWTRKEAYIKGVGGGLSIPLTSFDTSGPVPGWTFAELPSFGDCVGAVAVEGPIRLLQVWRWPASASPRA